MGIHCRGDRDLGWPTLPLYYFVGTFAPGFGALPILLVIKLPLPGVHSRSADERGFNVSRSRGPGALASGTRREGQ